LGPDIDKFETMAKDYAKGWSSRSPERVASFFAEDGRIEINRGEALQGREAIAEMAAGFFAEFPDLIVHCDGIRVAGNHAIFLWTLEGHHAKTKNYVKVRGWEEWELDDDLKVKSSLGWFAAVDYERQIAGSA
jgi:uncharacterized protein (TIGR02246 family)